MNELKAINLNSMGCYNINEPIYIKSEVDRYISELIADQQLELDEWYCRVEHHKYKRCVANYRYCAIKALYELDFKENDVEWKWYSKWMHKWYELAEKFKEAQ